MYELMPIFDGRKSFYGKAIVRGDGFRDGDATLFSYGIPVASRIDGRIALHPEWSCSLTTLRHVKEFIKQIIGDRSMSKTWLAETYPVMMYNPNFPPEFVA